MFATFPSLRDSARTRCSVRGNMDRPPATTSGHAMCTTPTGQVSARVAVFILCFRRLCPHAPSGTKQPCTGDKDHGRQLACYNATRYNKNRASIVCSMLGQVVTGCTVQTRVKKGRRKDAFGWCTCTTHGRCMRAALLTSTRQLQTSHHALGKRTHHSVGLRKNTCSAMSQCSQAVHLQQS